MNNSEDPCPNTNANNLFLNQNLSAGIRNNANEDENISGNVNTTSGVAGFDLESELREFLESDSALSSFHLPDDVDDTDKTIEQMLSAHSWKLFESMFWVLFIFLLQFFDFHFLCFIVIFDICSIVFHVYIVFMNE